MVLQFFAVGCWQVITPAKGESQCFKGKRRRN